MMFGTSYPKFTYSGSTVLLENSNMRPNWCERNYTQNNSIPDTGNQTVIGFEGDYSDFWVDVNLWEYKSPSSPTIKFNELYSYLYKYVVFYPHEDGTAISGSNNEPMSFFIDYMQHRYVDETDTGHDILSMHFNSISYTHLST